MITRKIFSYGTRNLFFAFAVILALAFTACDNDPTINPGVPIADPNSITYTGYDGEGKQYKLVITRGAESPGGIIGGPDGPGVYKDSGLVNGANDVWADSYPAGQRDGFIFKADGTFHLIDDYTDTTPGVWKIFGTGTWYNTVITGSSNRLTIIGSGGSKTYRYTVTSTTLTLMDSDGDSQTFTKTTATVSGRGAVTPAPEGKADTKAITGAIKRAVSADLGSPAGRAAAAGRAAYKPKSGDEFTLTIKDMLTGDTEGTSTGTVTDISSDGVRDTLTLDNDDKEFTVKVKDLFIEEITGPIPLDDGKEWEEPDTLYPNDPNNPGDGTGGPTDWIPVTNHPFGDGPINDIAYGNGKFVAVGRAPKENGGAKATIAYSTNGATWTAVEDNPFDTLIHAVAYGNDKFVAADSFAKMAYSDDGVTWKAVANTGVSWGANINAIAYGNNRWVAVGDGGTIAYSSNGTTWTAWTGVADSTIWKYTDSDGRSNRANIRDVAYGNGRFVAVGYEGKIAHSTDGASWTAENSKVGTYGLFAIAYGNGNFVAGSVITTYSSDGVTWTLGTAAPLGLYGMWSIGFGNNRFVAGSANGTTRYSADGKSWTTIATNNAFSGRINGIAYGNGRFVAVDEKGRMAYCNWP
jgi:hypothetical protein